MAYFLATNVLSDTPPVLTPCICSSRSQYIQLDNIDGTQPYIVESKIRLFGNNPGSSGDDYLGNYADTSYGNSWRFYNGGGSYSSTGGWSRFQDSHSRIDKNPCADIWFDFQEGPAIFKLGGDGNTYSFPTYTNADYPLCLFGLPDRPNNRSACALARTKITLNDVLVADLVPVNAYNEDRGAKEGGFYDVVNDKYYFSDTSTPLVYSEL